MKIYKFETSSCCQCNVATKKLIENDVVYDTIDCETAEGEILCDTFNVQSVPTVIVVDKDNEPLYVFRGLGKILENMDVIVESSKKDYD